MNAAGKINAAFSSDGTPEIPAVICYENLFVRDHWSELTDKPWWYMESPVIDQQLGWISDVITATGLDLFRLPLFYSREDRKYLTIEQRTDGVYRVDRRTGSAELLEKPRVSGWAVSGQTGSPHPVHPADTPGEVDSIISVPDTFDPNDIIAKGKHDLAGEIMKKFGGSMYPYYRVASPLWRCYNLWGFETMMVMIATKPELVDYASSRFLELSLRSVHEAASLGAQAVFIEECLTDMISPADFKSLNLPFLHRLVDEIRLLGMKSIYYFCGNPSGKWELLLDAGTDALSLEEGKKGFEIDIEDVVERVGSRCTVFGNLDSIGVLLNGTDEELRAEISRQIRAGRKNGSRFIMSTGSPVTPETPASRLRLYCDLVHELGR